MMGKDAEFYREKWKKCQERCEILEEDNRKLVEALEESGKIHKIPVSDYDRRDRLCLRLETEKLQMALDACMEPGETPEPRKTCLFCSGEISPYKRSDAYYCSAGCRESANSAIAYNRKKPGV